MCNKICLNIFIWNYFGGAMATSTMLNDVTRVSKQFIIILNLILVVPLNNVVSIAAYKVNPPIVSNIKVRPNNPIFHLDSILNETKNKMVSRTIRLNVQISLCNELLMSLSGIFLSSSWLVSCVWGGRAGLDIVCKLFYL